MAVVGLIVAAVRSNAHAATSNSLGINPRRDYTVKSGEKLQDTLYVSNLSKTEDLYITIHTIDFGPKDETGAPALMLKATTPTRWSLKPYLTIPPTVTIAAGKSISIPFSIAIPKTVGAGSYYSAIQYSTNGQDGSGSNVNLTSSAATLMFVRVPGEATDILRLKQFGAFTPYASGDNGSFGSYFGGSPPKYLAFRLTNDGNVAEQPNGSVILKNLFGKKVQIFEKANINNSIVLIGQTRRFDLCLNEERSSHPDPATGRNVDTVKCNQPKLTPGRYTARLALVYGDTGSSSHELGAVTSFWYLPLWFVVLAIVGLLIVVALIWLLIRKVRRGRGYRHTSRR
jgi:hypothetical protein